MSKRNVLITGCSDGGLGAALALAFHNAGFHVYATARSKINMVELSKLGIETIEMDVTSQTSIAEVAARVPSLDILVNNSGVMLTMPAMDTSIEQAKRMFDVNLWGMVAVSQAFVSHLLKTKGMIVNQTSVAATMALPWQAAYDASKAAAAMYSNVMRLELECVGIRVVDLRTGIVGPTNMIKNNYTKVARNADNKSALPDNSIFKPAKETMEAILRLDKHTASGMDPAVWAAAVVGDLSKSKPPPFIWRGAYALVAWLEQILPYGTFHSTVKKGTQLDVVEIAMKKAYQ
ncbi:short chain dehydrogenase [Cadophora sp. MPI-SDFR-AT-0126]|nr:short chain dehydrogenase [Leotiomycetes sp. MPI-SDFR-AT-0126]